VGTFLTKKTPDQIIIRLHTLPLYPAEAAKKFLLPPGYQIGPILTEPQIEQYQLDKVVGLGRIWRITYDGMERDKTPIQIYPRAYQLQVSLDGKNWNKTVAEGECNDPENVIAFYPVKAKFLRITQTGTLDGEVEKAPWSMKGLQLFGLMNEEVMVN